MNIKDVVLDKPRSGFRKEREPLLSLTITDTVFSQTAIREAYQEAGKPVPIKYRQRSDEISKRNYERYEEEIATGAPHFKVGGKQVYFPGARICLLRPNAKHTPYQAKFLVPKKFNKMDLRDYLWHVYGLRALNITVQLLHGKFVRGPFDYSRYREPQLKKMTVDMAEPFIWPEVPQNIVDESQADYVDEVKAIESKNGKGSDKMKPVEGFDGLFGRTILPDAFVSAQKREEGAERVREYNEKLEGKVERELVARFLKL